MEKPRKINSNNDYIVTISNRQYFLNEDAYIIFDLINKSQREINEFLTSNNISRDSLASAIKSFSSQLMEENYADTDEINFDYPVAFQWKITDSCNLNCKHCYISEKNKFKSLDNSSLKIILDKIVKIKPIYVLITGGECLTVDYIDEIIKTLSKNHIKVRIFTNGILLDKHIDVLKRFAKNVRINVSLDGNEEQHNYIRGVGTFSKTINNIKLCVENELMVSINTVINKKNYMSFYDMCMILYKMGVYSIQFSYLIIDGEATTNSKELSMTKNDYEKFNIELERLYEFFLKNRIKTLLFYAQDTYKGERHINYILSDESTRDTWCCTAGRSRVTIDSNGDVYPCAHLKNDFHMGNMINDDIRTLWNNKNRQSFLEFIDKNGKDDYICPVLKNKLNMEDR